jgi:hypothetical protein
MATYEVTDQQTGVKLRLTGDSPPTDTELVDIFAEGQPEPQQRGIGEEALRQGGLTARHAAQGLSNVFTGPNDAINMAINGVLSKLGIDYRQGSAVQAVSDTMTELGLPLPENATERVVGTASEFLAGGGGFVPEHGGGGEAEADCGVATFQCVAESE